MIDLSDAQVQQLNDFESFLSFKPTWAFKRFVNARNKTVGLFTGNQYGKTAGVAYSYVLRIFSMHPIPEKNIAYWECDECDEKYNVQQIPKKRLVEKDGEEIEEFYCACGGKLSRHLRKSKTFRFCSETLPGQSSNIDIEGTTAEVKNTQYPEFKKWLPKFLIKKDITFRSPTMVLSDPFGGDDLIVEFVSYKQSVQSTAGTQRVSVWYDEEPPKDFREEQQPRLLAENGDEVFTLTPANHISWLYDEVFEKAAVYYRTKAVANFLSEDLGKIVPQIERVATGKDIAVIQAATDDNPTLSPAAIEAILGSIDDPDVYAIRRFGIFKQVSGRVFKDFEYKTHYIKEKEYFPNGIPAGWMHARGIDYHPQTPWAFGAISLSPYNEAFIWLEYNPSPEKFTTEEIGRKIAALCSGRQFRLDLIDPLSEAHKYLDNQKRSVTIRDELNKTFLSLRLDGRSFGSNWQTWDTKGEKGRDEIRKRLKNSLRVGKPFNNKVLGEKGEVVYLPTLWVLDSCPLAAKSMRQWRWEDYSSTRQSHTKDEKNKVEQKWSHFNMVWEAIFKHPTFRPRRVSSEIPREANRKKHYFNSKG